MVNAHSDALSVALDAAFKRGTPMNPDTLRAAGARVSEPRIVLTDEYRAQLAAYNAARRQAVAAGCTVIDEQTHIRGFEVRADEAGRAFVERGGCTRRVLPSGAVVHRLINGVAVIYVEPTYSVTLTDGEQHAD